MYSKWYKYSYIPLCNYLGDDNKIPTYASNGSAVFTPKQIEDDVKSIIDKGYTAYKMRIGLQNKDIDLERVATARKYLGSYDLMVDAIMGTNPNTWNYETALQWSRDLHQYNVSWLEEPFIPTDIKNYSKLCSISNIPIAGGEALNQMLEFDLYYDKKAVDIIQPDVTNSGGISECIDIVNKFGNKNTAMHVWGSQIAINANKHFAKALNVSYLEVPMMELEINDHIKVDGPGIGIHVSQDIKDKYKLIKNIDFKI
jgi:L-alanine-DL-glutamate epimerase-like enolase superfamily enzyme